MNRRPTSLPEATIQVICRVFHIIISQADPACVASGRWNDL